MYCMYHESTSDFTFMFTLVESFGPYRAAAHCISACYDCELEAEFGKDANLFHTRRPQTRELAIAERESTTRDMSIRR